MSDANGGPAIVLESRGATRVNGSWRIHWRVTNEGGEPVRLLAVRAPHRRFRSEAVDLNVVVAGSASVDQTARVEVAPGEAIDDGVVVFVAVRDRETWRIQFRVRVAVTADATLAATVVARSAERIGSSVG